MASSDREMGWEAPCAWPVRRATRPRDLAGLKLAGLKAEIDRGLADLTAGRVRDFDAGCIIERGRTRLARHSGSA